jgi:hypothetical protein
VATSVGVPNQKERTMNTTSARVGLAILGVLSVGDIAQLALSDGKHPPIAVAIVGAVLGLASLPLVVRSWKSASASVRGLSWLRVLSAVTALPAFVVDDVPAAATVAAAGVVALTALGLLLVLSGRTSSSVVTA